MLANETIGLYGHVYACTEPKTSVDWRQQTPRVLNPVRDQGEAHGCTAKPSAVCTFCISYHLVTCDLTK